MTNAAAAGTQHSRADLEAATERYLQALVAGDPALAGLAPDAVFAENDQQLPVGEASWRTVEALGTYRHVFADPEVGEVSVIATVVENGQGAIVVVRLRLVGGLVTEAEQFMLRDPNGYDTYEKLGAPDAVWLEPVPVELRQSREALQAASWMYFQALERNDGAGIYPFLDDCERIEHGRRTLGAEENEAYGHADAAVEFMSQKKAKAQYELGMMAFVTRARDRRTLTVDVERGAVLGSCFFDFDGTLEAIHFADGKQWTIPPYFRTPRSHHMNEAFKVLAGSYRHVEMTLLEIPHATRPVWRTQPRVQLDYTPTSPPPSPITTDRATLLELTDAFVDGLISDCVHALPLAPDAVYTENGVPVELGEGLWKSVRGRGDYRVRLADPASGQCAYVGDLDENGLFAMLAARLGLRDGLIARIEVVIARPESAGEWGKLAESTSTMFTPPLVADLRPDGFRAVAPALVRAPGTPAASAEPATLVDRYFAAFEAHDASLAPLADPCTRRENGVAATGNPNGPVVDPQRPEFGLFAGGLADQLDAGYVAAMSRLRRGAHVADAEAGLVLDFSVLDHPADERSVSVPGVGPVAAAASFQAPTSDVCAQLFKVDGGRIEHVEALVRRVTYGQPIVP